MPDLKFSNFHFGDDKGGDATREISRTDSEGDSTDRKTSIYGREASVVGGSDRRRSYAEINRISSVSGPVIPEDETGGSVVNAMLIIACASFGAASFLFGFDNAIISPVVALEPFVAKYQGLNPVTHDYTFTANNQDLLFSVPLVGSIIGAVCAPWLTGRFGRKWPLVGSYFLSLGGVFLQLFAPNLAAFVIGRFWNSFITGIASVIAPLYLSEIVPPSMRGAAVASINVLTLCASVLAAGVAYGTHNIKGIDSFRIPLGIQCVPPGLLIPLTVFLPESPQWLASKDRMEAAKKNLTRVRGYSEAQIDDELRVIKMCEDNERALASGVRFWHLFNKSNLERTVVAGSMFSFNQISGIILTTTYATVFLTQLNVGDPFEFTLVAQVCVLLGTMVAPFTMDRAGRRPTALSGMIVLFFIDVAAGALAFFADTNRNAGLALVALSFIFNLFWASSFYSVSNLLPAEIASVKMRNYTMSYTIAWAQTTAVITTFAVPQLTSPTGANLGAKTYLVFAGCMFLIIIWVYVLVPETKGRTFAEIDEMYYHKVPKRKWASYVTSTEAKSASVVPTEQFNAG